MANLRSWKKELKNMMNDPWDHPGDSDHPDCPRCGSTMDFYGHDDDGDFPIGRRILGMPKLWVQDFRKPALKRGKTMNTLMRTLTITATVCGLVASVCNTLGKSIQFAYSLKEVK